MWTWKDWAVFGIAIIIAGGLSVLAYQAYQWEQIGQLERCAAAKTTILEESAVLQAVGKFPGEQITDRWAKLLGGCL